MEDWETSRVHAQDIEPLATMRAKFDRLLGTAENQKNPDVADGRSCNLSPMSLAEVLHELPAWTLSERQLLVARALELDNPGLSVAEEALIESRLADHRSNPSSSVPLDTMKTRLRLLFTR
jgi:hypothetical protein